MGLAEKFLELYRYARDSLATISDYMDREFKSGGLGPVFQRNLCEVEERNLLALLDLIENSLILGEGQDSRWWIPSTEGVFTVASFVEVNNTICSRQMNSLWKLNAPPRMPMFGWLVLRGGTFSP